MLCVRVQNCGTPNPGLRRGPLGQRCDQSGAYQYRVRVFSLVTNYHNLDEIDRKGSLDKCRKIVEGAFGSSSHVVAQIHDEPHPHSLVGDY